MKDVTRSGEPAQMLSSAGGASDCEKWASVPPWTVGDSPFESLNDEFAPLKLKHKRPACLTLIRSIDLVIGIAVAV